MFGSNQIAINNPFLLLFINFIFCIYNLEDPYPLIGVSHHPPTTHHSFHFYVVVGTLHFFMQLIIFL